MQGQKKYCLNVSSYKYKRECMKLLPPSIRVLTTFNNNETIESENLCPGGKHCKNYGLILNLEQKIKELNDTVNQLTKINEYSESKNNKNITPKKIIEPRRQDSFNEFTNSFRNSIKKRKIKENNRNIKGNITLPSQISEPYRIKPYSSISIESKIPFKKICNKKHINLELNNNKNYKTKFYFNTDKSDINEQYFLNKNENDIKNNDEDKIGKKEKEVDDNHIQKLYSSFSKVYNNIDEIPINKNNKKNNNSLNEEKSILKKNIKKNEEEIKNNNEFIQNKDLKKIIHEKIPKNTIVNKKESKKMINNMNLPIIKKVKTYKLIDSLKSTQNKNQRYELELLENKIHLKDENKLYFRKFKGGIRNSFNTSNSKFLSHSFGFNNKNQRAHDLFNLEKINTKTLSSQNRLNKIKMNSFNNFRPLSLTQKPFKVKFNINNFISNKNKSDFELISRNNKNNLSDSFEFKKFMNELEKEEDFSEKNIIFNEIYDLSSYKYDILVEKVKSLTKEKIDIYCSFINNSLKYLKDLISILNKFKIFHNLINNSKNKEMDKNQNKNTEFLVNEEFKKYKENSIKLLNCEKIRILIYDSILDCLISKGENEELKFPKDKDLPGLSFTLGKKVRYESENNSSISISNISKNDSSNKINNLLIYPLKDKNDSNNIYGIIEAINKIEDKENIIYKDNYFKDKPCFNKNDEIMMTLISKDLGNFCKFYNLLNYNNIYISYYHTLLLFCQRLLLKNEDKAQNNIIYFNNEVTEVFKIIFEINDIQILIYKKEYFYDIQKNKRVPLEGLINKAYKDKKINYTSNPLINNYYSKKSDLNINLLGMNKNEELITIPILELKNNNIIMIIQIKTNKKLGNMQNNNSSGLDEKLSDDNYFIIENISFIIQKYLSENNL